MENLYIKNSLSRLLVGLTLCFAGIAMAGDWPVFRGDCELRGLAGGELGTKPELMWIRKVGEGDVSSPVVSGDKVFVCSSDGKVCSLGLNDGHILWSFNSEEGIEAPPLLLDGRVYAGGQDGKMRAFDAKKGKVLWEYKTGDQIMGSANWFRRNKDAAAYIIFGSYDNHVYCLDSDSGDLIWKYETKNFINGTPASGSRSIVFGGCDEYMRALDAGTGEEKVKVKVGSYIAGSVAFDDNKGFAGHYGGKLVCVDFDKKKMIWQYGSEDSAPFFSSPAVTENRVIIGGRDKNLHCVRRGNGAKEWIFRTKGNVDGCPVVVGDKIVFGSGDGRVYLVRLKDGRKLAEYDVGLRVLSTPAITGNKVIIGAQDGKVFAIRFKK